MALSDLVTDLLSGTDTRSPDTPTNQSTAETSSLVYECRNCGTTVTPETIVCPNCDHDEIVEYPVD
ncbi:hypothetical protein ACLI4Y_10225 [Natrialbaceae archaeon A-CW3]